MKILNASFFTMLLLFFLMDGSEFCVSGEIQDIPRLHCFVSPVRATVPLGAPTPVNIVFINNTDADVFRRYEEANKIEGDFKIILLFPSVFEYAEDQILIRNNNAHKHWVLNDADYINKYDLNEPLFSDIMLKELKSKRYKHGPR